jgi:4-hydroxy-tetrahydrodipicolinate reductase
MISVAVTGAAGRMGKMIISAIDREAGFRLVGAIEAAGNPAIGADAGLNAGVAHADVAITDDARSAIEKADVLIDFSIPEATLRALKSCSDAGVAVVTGTTGIKEAQRKKFDEFAKKIPIVAAPNMSMGVNLLFRLTREVTEILGKDFDVEIIEMHHNQKVDAPSGTARKLLEITARALGRNPDDVGNYGRAGHVGKRTPEEIGVLAVRAGDTVGEHTVIFGGSGERLELVHKAHSRMTFVRGAIRAAAWIVTKKPGLYDMLDVLGLK